VFVAARQLRALGHTVAVTNSGIPTAAVSRRFQDLGRQYGHEALQNLIDGEVPFVPSSTTDVTIFAGGNDVNIITAALRGGAGSANQTAYVDQQVANFAADMRAVVDGVRARADRARIVALNLPNLGAMPYLATSSRAQQQAVQRASVGITTTAINPLASQGVRVVDLMCEERLYQRSSLAGDGFHPSDTGYALIAGEVVRAITAATHPAPRSSCPQMTLVP
jgi:lysophospholipase L1-like esterase